MAFGQQAGPPATGKQVQELLSLLASAGHSDFRDARGPMGFTQRQAGGRFTRDEADAFIARLQQEEAALDATADADGSARTDAPAGAAGTAQAAGRGGGGGRSTPDPVAGPAADRAPAPRPVRGGASPAAIGQVLRHMPTGQLAEELRRRGCMVIEP